MHMTILAITTNIEDTSDPSVIRENQLPEIHYVTWKDARNKRDVAYVYSHCCITATTHSRCQKKKGKHIPITTNRVSIVYTISLFVSLYITESTTPARTPRDTR